MFFLTSCCLYICLTDCTCCFLDDMHINKQKCLKYSNTCQSFYSYSYSYRYIDPRESALRYIRCCGQFKQEASWRCRTERCHVWKPSEVWGSKRCEKPRKATGAPGNRKSNWKIFWNIGLIFNLPSVEFNWNVDIQRSGKEETLKWSWMWW